jgi:uncharacterized protein YgiM (DUF1202 family)
MTNPNHTDLEGMIARIEEANARAYEQLGRADENDLKSEPDSTRLPPARPDPPAASKRRLTRARPLFVAFIGLLLAASAGVTAFAWEPSYGDTAKQMIARWAKPWVFQTAHQAPPLDGVPAAPPISPEIAQRLQKMADDLANVEQQIEQLKASQEQMVRDNAKVFDQLNASLAQMTRQNAAVAKQLKATQEQLADVASANPARRRRP